MTAPIQWAIEPLDLDVETFADSIQFRDFDGVFDGPLLSTLPDEDLDLGRRREHASDSIAGKSGRKSGSCLLEKGGTFEPYRGETSRLARRARSLFRPGPSRDTQ